MNDQVEVIKDEWGTVKQVKAPEGLADIVMLDDYSYEIRFYGNGDFEAAVEKLGDGYLDEPMEVLTGGYAPTPSAVPMSVWKIENPNGSSSYDELTITHTLGGSEEYEFADAGGGTMTLNRSGLQQEEVTETTLGNGDKQVIRVVKNGSGVANYKVRSVYRNFPWGERQVEEEVDPDGASLTTTWDYYDNDTTDGAAYSQLKKVVNANGSWERYEYDSEGRRNKVVSTWLDGAPNAAENASRVVTTSWAGSNPVAATIVETAAGQEVGRRYLVTTPGVQTTNIVCTVAGSGTGASTNLVTVTDYVTSGTFKGKVSQISHPDGTKTIYTYTPTSESIITTQASGSASGGSIVAGKQTITTEDLMGNLKSREIVDVASGLTLEEMTVTASDEFGRPTLIEYDDGTSEERHYDCCGMDSLTGRDGVVTSYTYNKLKQLETESRGGITTIYAYNGTGKVKTKTRRGSDDTEIVVETNDYDLAGRLISRENALEDETTIGETFDGSGRLVRTTTNPDGGTQIETIHKDGRTYTIAGTAVAPRKFEYGTHGNGEDTKEIRVGVSGAETEWAKTTRDLAGRTVAVEGADGAETTMVYNTKGQLSKEVDPDGVTTLYFYNGEGEREKTVIDMDRNDAVGSTDKVTINESSVLTAHGATVQRRETRVVNASNAEVVASRVDTTPNGRASWMEQWGLVTTSTTAYESAGVQTTTITRPDGTVIEQMTKYGRPEEQTVKMGGSTIITSSTNTYDKHGRLETMTDVRNGTTTLKYTDLDQVKEVTTPSPGLGGGAAQLTKYYYDEMGRKEKDVLPDESEILTEYYPTGALKKKSGSQTYTEEYTYDPQGRMKTLVTTGQAGPATTTWIYDGVSGRLSEKTYADGKGTSYTYTDTGRLETRTWERGVVTTYSYDNGGELGEVDYSDSTPDVAYTRNRLGQVTGITDGSGTRTLTVSEDGRLLTETYTSGMFNGVETTIDYDGLKRRDDYSLEVGATTIPVGYTYDGASRLATVTSGDDVATYSYVTNSNLIGGIVQTHESSTVLTTTKTYDNLNRLYSISASTGSGVVSSHTYAYNDLNQRTEAALQDGTKWGYGYDGLGQVTSAGRKWSDNSDVAGQQYGYTFDGIGNRLTATVNGRTADYEANTLNQYTEREVPGAIDVVGSATSTATVTVNSQATSRKGDYFYKELEVDNAAASQYEDITVTAVKNGMGGSGEDLVGEESGHAYVSKTPEVYTYDDDGNLLTDGRWQYSWDGENRLIAMESLSGAPTASKKKLEFAYDGQSRRISKKVYGWNGSSYASSAETRFLYEGGNLIAELDGGNLIKNTFTWGADLSGGRHGAGGVSGLLVIQKGSEGYYPCYDGNGNVMTMVKASNSDVVARYHYGPFGESIQAFEEQMENPFRFSTKYHDRETSLAYYGYRFYNPSAGKWISRDPIGEAGGRNIYGFVENSPVRRVDYKGLLIFVLDIQELNDYQPDRVTKVSELDDDAENDIQGMEVFKEYLKKYKEGVRAYADYVDQNISQKQFEAGVAAGTVKFNGTVWPNNKKEEFLAEVRREMQSEVFIQHSGGIDKAMARIAELKKIANKPHDNVFVQAHGDKDGFSTINGQKITFNDLNDRLRELGVSPDQCVVCFNNPSKRMEEWIPDLGPSPVVEPKGDSCILEFVPATGHERHY